MRNIEQKPDVLGEMQASIERTAFPNAESPIIPFVSKRIMDYMNEHIGAEPGKHPSLLVVGPDAVIVDDGPVTQLKNRSQAELLGYYVATRCMKISGEYYGLGLFDDISNTQPHSKIFWDAWKFLNENLVDQDGYPLALKTGSGRGTRSGIPNVIVSDMRITPEYSNARQQLVEELMKSHILKGGTIPDHSELGGLRGAKRALQYVSQKMGRDKFTLDDGQRGRFENVAMSIAMASSDTGSASALVHKPSRGRRRRSLGNVTGGTPTWFAKGSCDSATKWFFNSHAYETEVERSERVDKAKQICSGCGVKAECRDFAISNKEYLKDKGRNSSVWGGMTTEELAVYAKSSK